jgi:hypothetical protein
MAHGRLTGLQAQVLQLYRRVQRSAGLCCTCLSVRGATPRLVHRTLVMISPCRGVRLKAQQGCNPEEVANFAAYARAQFGEYLVGNGNVK